MAAPPSPAQPSPAALSACVLPPRPTNGRTALTSRPQHARTAAHRLSRPAALPPYTSQGLELEKDNATYVRCTKQELQLVVDALAQRKEESLEFKERAIEAFNVQNFKRAEQHLSSAIELDPENHVFYSNRAAAYMAMEKFDRALKDANECVRLQPTWAKGYSRRAAAKFHLGDLQAAKLAYSKAWDLEPTNAKTKADLEHVLSEIAGMRVVLPDRQA